jgi:hypothetical protein
MPSKRPLAILQPLRTGNNFQAGNALEIEARQVTGARLPGIVPAYTWQLPGSSLSECLCHAADHFSNILLGTLPVANADPHGTAPVPCGSGEEGLTRGEDFRHHSFGEAIVIRLFCFGARMQKPD